MDGKGAAPVAALVYTGRIAVRWNQPSDLVSFRLAALVRVLSQHTTDVYYSVTGLVFSAQRRKKS